MASKLDIDLYGSSLNIVKQCGPALSDVLNSKFGCVATIEGVDVESDLSFAQQKRPTAGEEKRLSVRLPAGVHVSVWKADLATFKVDAVVNAANSCLQHGAGLARALCEAGGSQIQKESDIHIKTHGPLTTGQAVITTAGSLPCKVIIHSVGPQLPYFFTPSDVLDAKPQLQKAIRSILDRVKENHLDTVAIPAISSGLFRYPLQECAETIVSTVKDYYEYASTKEHLPQEIFFVNRDEPTVSEMGRACRQILAPQLEPYSQAGRSNTRGATKTSDLTLQIGNVLLTLKSANIEDQVVDVIVNTASTDKELGKGQISFALLKKAGHKMQEEIRHAPVKKYVIVTKAYNLGCKEVFHTFCVSKGQNASEQILYDSVFECLKLAAEKRYKSVAFPAIGTGHLGFTKQEAAATMLAAVVMFGRMFPGKMDIYFVIFPSDYGTFQAFEAEMMSQQKTAHSSMTPALKGDRAPAPHISLSARSEESASEAEKWLTRLLFKASTPVHICNNFIQHFGEKEYVQLSHRTKKGVKLEEFFKNGRTYLKVDGDSAEDVVVAAVQVEAMLCTVQKEFVMEEKKDMCLLLAKDVPLKTERTTKTVDHSQWELSDFKNQRLSVVKMHSVENPALKMLFDLKKQQLGCSSSEKMFQRIPAQFCEMVSQIGFHAQCAPPEDPEYGEGIYFARTVKEAMEVWKEKNDQYLYFVVAEVLKGKSTPGKPGLILPPAVGTDPQVRFDSVTGGSDTCVIFSGYQALPISIITCKKMF